jgi:hypothetical protein
MRAILLDERLQESDSLSFLIDKSDSKTHIDTARQSALAGKKVHEYEKARAEGKSEEYLKGLADEPESVDKHVSDQQLMQYINIYFIFSNFVINIRVISK